MYGASLSISICELTHVSVAVVNKFHYSLFSSRDRKGCCMGVKMGCPGVGPSSILLCIQLKFNCLPLLFWQCKECSLWERYSGRQWYLPDRFVILLLVITIDVSAMEDWDFRSGWALLWNSSLSRFQSADREKKTVKLFQYGKHWNRNTMI